MGACDFETISFGKDVKDAFHKACEEARSQYGNDSYNGTISTTEFKGQVNTVIMKGKQYTTQNRQTSKKLQRIIEHCIENEIVKKWECKAIELRGKELGRQKEAHGLKGKKCKGFIFFGLASC